jgi:cell division septation protein DedD
MRNSETGEFELLVGNRQLLSGFFIVVLLFAVAFSMGYIVGRNSSPSAKSQAETASSSGTASQTPETRPQPVSQAPAAGGAPPADAAATGAPPADTPPQPSTQPERGGGSPSGPAAPPAAPPAAASAAPPGPGGTPTEAAPGSYWQILATASQTSADAMRQTMKDKGFPASLQPGPNNLIRVLIGPYSDKQSLGRAKTELENAGVHPVLMK